MVAALGGGLAGAAVTAALHKDEPAVTATVGTRAVADEPTSLAELYKQVSPSVVEVETQAPALGPFGGQPTGTGAGWLYDARNIVTNQHVVDDAQEVSVRFADGTEIDARVVGSDPSTDVALLELTEPAEMSPLARGSSEALEVGDPVVAIGSPFGLEGSLTSGVVSGPGTHDPVADARRVRDRRSHPDGRCSQPGATPAGRCSRSPAKSSG